MPPPSPSPSPHHRRRRLSKPPSLTGKSVVVKQPTTSPVVATTFCISNLSYVVVGQLACPTSSPFHLFSFLHFSNNLIFIYFLFRQVMMHMQSE
ncbi:unnamed protein product [Nippostrongylus brasiliensis]|uniref:Uncharacterized protein n=1 Tax=Nippostrongylus brasiliensis TaxID=27835 RepID=A0A0N4XJM7_NIPBR|nr:unnamed protein product [Nippostrongylus brasiliensis]